jgi:hypothetical protein
MIVVKSDVTAIFGSGNCQAILNNTYSTMRKKFEIAYYQSSMSMFKGRKYVGRTDRIPMYSAKAGYHQQ